MKIHEVSLYAVTNLHAHKHSMDFAKYKTKIESILHKHRVYARYEHRFKWLYFDAIIHNHRQTN
jgi:hypothetical protein